MQETTYNIQVRQTENGFVATVESPSLRVEAQTLDGVLLAIERELARAVMEADQQAQAIARAS